MTADDYKLENIKLSDLVFDERYQMRADPVDHSDYRMDLENSGGEWIFPPIRCCRVGGKVFVINGFTRGAAAIDYAKAHPDWVPVIPALVRRCNAKQALIDSFASNADNGFRRTNADKRKATLQAIATMEGKTCPEIASACRVSHTYVYNLVAQLKKPDKPVTKSDLDEAKSQLDSKAKSEAAAIEKSNAEKEAKKAAAKEKTELEKTLGTCPVCGSSEWNEDNQGYTCAKCLHPHGEPAGLSGDEEIPEPQEKTTEPEACCSDVSANDGAVNMHVERVKKLKALHGQLVRGIESLGMFKQLRVHLDAISTALSEAKHAV